MINDKLSFCVIKFHELEKSKKDYLQSQPINDKLSFRYIKFRELDLWSESTLLLVCLPSTDTFIVLKQKRLRWSVDSKSQNPKIPKNISFGN